MKKYFPNLILGSLLFLPLATHALSIENSNGSVVEPTADLTKTNQLIGVGIFVGVAIIVVLVVLIKKKK